MPLGVEGVAEFLTPAVFVDLSVNRSNHRRFCNVSLRVGVRGEGVVRGRTNLKSQEI